MKKLLSIILVLLTLGVIADHALRPYDERPQAIRFREAMNFASFSTYADPDFDYTFSYPSFFQRDDQPAYGPGHVSFSYHGNDVNLVMTCRVVPAHAIACSHGSFITSHRLPDVDRYVILSHGVRRHGCWYVLTFCYPADYREAVSRIIHQVNTWKAEPPQRVIFKPSAARQSAK